MSRLSLMPQTLCLGDFWKRVVSSLRYLDVTLGGSRAWPAARLPTVILQQTREDQGEKPRSRHLPLWGKYSCNNNDLSSTLSTALRGEHSECEQRGPMGTRTSLSYSRMRLMSSNSQARPSLSHQDCPHGGDRFGPEEQVHHS